MNSVSEHRRKARELVLQALFQQEFQSNLLLESLAKLKSIFAIEEDVFAYALLLSEGMDAKMPELDRKIADLSRNWKIDRMSFVDKNILRLAIYEMNWVDEIPPKVAINEALEIAKKYGSTDSFKFVNGVLDQMLKENP